MGIGPSGKFPGGEPLRPGDKGSGCAGVTTTETHVYVGFGTLLSWIILTPAEARAFAGTLLRAADELEGKGN